MPKITALARTQSVELFRMIAVFAVIVIHAAPFEYSSSPIGNKLDLATIINQLARFAVPFFFTISGYFWGVKVARYGSLLKPTISAIKRILLLFFVWSLIYLFPWNLSESMVLGINGLIKIIYWNMVAATKNIPKMLIRGTESHLWYLSALVCNMAISALFIQMRCVSLLVFLALLLYIAGITGKAYSETPLGFHSEFTFYFESFYSLIFFVTGFFFQRVKYKPNWLMTGVKLLILGVVIHFSELYMLNWIWGVSMHQSFVFGTYLFGVGTALIALSDFNLPILSRAASVGPLVLGIYTSHFIFIELFKPMNRLCEGNVAWALFYPVIVFIFSYILSLGLSKNKLTKFLVC
jgi:surface polysaccharide O-acyltransferase-like enzyme